MSVFVRQGKNTVRMGFQSDPIDPTKTRLKLSRSGTPIVIYLWQYECVQRGGTQSWSTQTQLRKTLAIQALCSYVDLCLHKIKLLLIPI